ncbi:GMC oxidoreductase [Aplosporella prunicola CBS 121167]|uniref:GMC oxidoreductase n=1 Tax=Aplosporella prunicola CBS 121167 TaxID=1176127 RepID=A0A6A6BH93_9PEZI|nr:GMC oxidoreductase [Aplosporella prunicola CBS 121167]KAF2142695.1 GMC oxidoreductase [Aplosporella prunicola CBS 121167]
MPRFYSLLSFAALLAFSQSRPINDALLDEYDYIIVGGGASGLTVADRLTEDADVTVLVLEAGPADQNEEWIRVPFFMGNSPNPPAGSLSSHVQYDWNLGTEPQTYLDGATRHYPLGRGVGGGTLINGMLWNRGNVGDYDDWETLGNEGWGWEGMLPYFKRSESFTADYSAEDANLYQIQSNPDMHGTQAGGVSVSYQQYYYNGTASFYDGLNELGIPTEGDPSAGTTAGASFLPMTIDATTKTRSDARTAHHQPHIGRDNLYLSTGQFVTLRCGRGQGREGALPNVRVRGVEYATDSSAPRRTITARRDVILAAGAVHTPKLLQHSGIGDSDLLSSFNITTTINLPGVGNNYQDHFMIATNNAYQSTTYDRPLGYGNTTRDEANRAEFNNEHSGPWTAGPPNGVAFPSLSNMAGANFTAILNAAQNQGSGQYLQADLDETVVAGYERQKQLLVDALGNANRSQFEVLNDNTGHFTYSVMKPLGRGQIRIRSDDPFDTPIIDPRYGSNPVDLSYLVEAMRFNYRLMGTDALRDLQPSEKYPTEETMHNDDALMQLVKEAIFTEYHPTGTTSMLPLELGGVVDSNLKVYGTQNLKIVDSGVMPLIPAAHLQACVYGVAEKAADLIKAANRS